MFHRIKRYRFIIHLEDGQALSVRANAFTVNYSRVDGTVIDYSAEDAKGHIPFYINPRKIVAVTKKG